MELFKSRFPKVYDTQWSLAGALFINICVQTCCFGFSRWVKNDVQLRMIMEENHDRFFVCILVFLISWVLLYSFSRKVDTIIAIGLLNINTLAWVYINGQTNEVSDPDRAHTFILQLFMLADAISSWL